MKQQFSTLIFSTITLAYLSGCGGDGGDGLDTTIPQASIKNIVKGFKAIDGAKLNLDASQSTDDVAIVKYEWTLDKNQVSTKMIDDIDLNFGLGEHELCLIVTDGDNKSTMKCEKINIVKSQLGKPTVIINSSLKDEELKTKCPITMSAAQSKAGTGGSIAKYQWSMDGKIVGTEETQDFSFDTTGNYTITLKITDNENNSETKTRTITILEHTQPTVKLTMLNPYQQTIFSDQSSTNITWPVSSSDKFIPSEGNHVFFSVEGSYDDCNTTDDNLTYIWDGRIYGVNSRNHCFAQKPFLRKMHRDFNTTGQNYPSFATVLQDDPSDFRAIDPVPTRVPEDVFNATKYIYPYDTSLTEGDLAPSKEINTPYVYIELCEGQNLDYNRLEITLTVKDNLHNKQTVIKKTIEIKAAVQNGG